jgi:hypothetical protein
LAGSNAAADADLRAVAVDNAGPFDLPARLRNFSLLPVGLFDRAFFLLMVFRIGRLLQVVNNTPSEFSPLSLILSSCPMTALALGAVNIQSGT